MFLEVILYLLIGIFLGVIAGLIPGIHPNTFAFLLLSLSPILNLDIFYLIAILIGAEIANSFVDFIPSVLFFAPEEDTALSILPGQKFLLYGRGYEGIYLTVSGGVISSFIVIALLPLFVISIPLFYNFLKPFIIFLLILTIIHLFLTQKKNKFYAVLIFIFSAIYGILIFRLPLSGTEVLFPAFSSLFGLSSLFFAGSREEIPDQEIDFNLEDCSKIKSSITAVFSGLFSGILPGVGSSQVTVISQQLARIKNLKDFMISIGGITTINSIFSIIALWCIGNPRSGVSVAIQNFGFEINIYTLFFVIFLIAISVGISAPLTLFLSKILIKNIHKIKYNKLTRSIFILLIVLIFVTTGWIGLLTALVGFLIGIFCIHTEVRRSFMMGVLIIPTILIFLGI
ncbi:MAG: hypothetical protein B6U88_02450 [Candidatus Aenigmarchaeota archaeon ex4484_56]|nr:MAG: hypothetical protein B6U88_02450 [Candidatus Aenigmarchaeota archaeon ex4484_56]